MSIALVAGLGNPGQKYLQTRHNAGFWYVDELVARNGGQFRPSNRFLGEFAEIDTAAGRCRVLKPTTFMNRSGQAVRALADYYGIGGDELLVVHDELDLEPGVARLKRGGGPGGHNGLKDVIAHLGNPGFLRLRLGIGRPTPPMAVVDYVLGRPGLDEKSALDSAIEAALSETDAVLTGDVDRAMNRLHSSA